MEKEKKNDVKPHKYNVGDEITVKIAKLEFVGNRPAYRIKGIENIKISEKAIEQMQVKKIKPGDVIYQVAMYKEEDIIWFDAAVVEDIATKHIKILEDWIEMESEDYKIFINEEHAEDYAISLAQDYGYRIIKGGLFEQEESNV